MQKVAEKLDNQLKIRWKKALSVFFKILLGLGIFYLLVGVGVVMSNVLSGVIGVLIYRIIGVPASFHYEIQWNLLTSYFSGIPSAGSLIPVTLAGGLITTTVLFCACAALWFRTRKSQRVWNISIESALLFCGLVQLLSTVSVVSDLIYINSTKLMLS